MDGAKIFFSHMVKARILFCQNQSQNIFVKKKTQAPPPGSLMVAPLHDIVQLLNGHIGLNHAHPDGSIQICT